LQASGTSQITLLSCCTAPTRLSRIDHLRYVISTRNRALTYNYVKFNVEILQLSNLS
jgi:hypothetical protein